MNDEQNIFKNPMASLQVSLEMADKSVCCSAEKESWCWEDSMFNVFLIQSSQNKSAVTSWLAVSRTE